MAARKPREQEEFEAFERAKRSLERKLQDIEWKHSSFIPRLEQFRQGRLHINGTPRLEVEPSEDS